MDKQLFNEVYAEYIDKNNDADIELILSTLLMILNKKQRNKIVEFGDTFVFQFSEVAIFICVCSFILYFCMEQIFTIL